MSACVVSLMTAKDRHSTGIALDTFINWCVRVDNASSTLSSTPPLVIYGTTLGAVPGLLFYVFLADPVRRNGVITHQTKPNGNPRSSYLVEAVTWENRPWMKSFFDAFGSYARYVSHLAANMPPNASTSLTINTPSMVMPMRVAGASITTPSTNANSAIPTTTSTDPTKGLRIVSRALLGQMSLSTENELMTTKTSFINASMRYDVVHDNEFWNDDVIEYMKKSSHAQISVNKLDVPYRFGETYVDAEHGTAYLMRSPVVFGLSISRIEHVTVVKRPPTHKPMATNWMNIGGMTAAASLVVASGLLDNLTTTATPPPDTTTMYAS